jgi:hypothetical protein
MTVRTRYFVIVSLLVIVVGLGTGLVAYYVGFPTSAFFSKAVLKSFGSSRLGFVTPMRTSGK